MKNFFRKFSTANKGLRYKMMLAFSLMSVIPLLACTYLISLYIFPEAESLINISGIIVFAIVIAMLGLLLAKGLIDPVIDMAIEAKMIASGEYDRKIAIESDDEIGNLGSSINQMTLRIKSNLDELKNYGQRMREINVDVHKKVLALSSLLQIGDIISSGSIQIDSLLELAVEKASMVFDSGFGILYLAKDGEGDLLSKTSYGLEKEKLENIMVRRDGKGLLNKVLDLKSILVADKGAKLSKDVEEFLETYGLRNMLAIPLFSGRKNLGLLIIGTAADDFKFRTDDIDLVKVFAKQMTIAIESDILSKKNEELAIKDELTDLYNKNFILTRLEDEIKRAIFYQRPCSLIIFNIDNFRNFREREGELIGEEVIKKAAKLIKDSSTPVAKVARIGGDEFAMLLPERNKKEAAMLAEDVRKKVEAANLAREGIAKLTISAGVSENPIDGATCDELLKKAADNLRQAKLMGKNKVAS